MNAIHLLRDARVRAVAAREALCAGDVIEASSILSDLEFNLAASLEQVGDGVIRLCLDDFNDVPSYGRGDKRIEEWCRAYLNELA